MSRYRGAIQATRIEHIHATERPRKTRTTCVRCPAAVNGARPGGMCDSCRQVAYFEGTAQRLGIDLSALADDEFVVAVDGGKRKRRSYRIVKESELDQLENAEVAA